MNKIKVILLSVISIILLAVAVEGITYCIQSERLVREGYKFINNAKRPPYPIKIETFSNHYDKMNKVEFFENKSGTNYKQRPIIVFGDVYANSIENDEETFTQKLARITKRPVYNFASAGWGIQHMYYLLKTEEYLSTIKNPEAVLYIYVDDQKRRLNSFSFYPHHDFLYLKYKIENDILTEEIPKMLIAYHSYFIRSIERYMGLRKSDSKNPNVQQKNYKLMKSLFEESRRIAKTRYPDLNKFIILRYVSNGETVKDLKNNENSANAQLEYTMWDKLKHEGFIITDVNELSTDEFNSKEYRKSDSSPKEEAYDKIIPLLVKKTGLK